MKSHRITSWIVLALFIAREQSQNSSLSSSSSLSSLAAMFLHLFSLDHLSLYHFCVSIFNLNLLSSTTDLLFLFPLFVFYYFALCWFSFLIFSDSYGPENDANQDGVDMHASICSSVSTGKNLLLIFFVLLHVLYDFFIYSIWYV